MSPCGLGGIYLSLRPARSGRDERHGGSGTGRFLVGDIPVGRWHRIADPSPSPSPSLHQLQDGAQDGDHRGQDGAQDGYRRAQDGAQDGYRRAQDGDHRAVKTEITAVKTEIIKEITTQFKEILDDVKASSAAEVERQVKTEIADKRLP